MIWSRFYTNPRLTALVVIFVLTLGAMALLALARQEDPTMVERWSMVRTFVPGASAERMEALVSEPIETKLRELPEIDEISSTSKAGISILQVQLYDSVAASEVNSVWSEVRDKLGEVQNELPVAASKPDLEITKPLASTMVVALRWEQDTPIELGILSRLADTLESRLANMPGTEETDVFGAADEEILVSLDAYRVANAGLLPAQIAQRIALADTKISAGRLRGVTTDLLVEVDAELDSPERIARVPVTATADGSVLRVSDLGTVTKHRVDPPRTIALWGDQRVVFVNAKMQPGLQIGNWVARARTVVGIFADELPNGIGAEIVYDQHVYTGQRMDVLALNLLFALAIVMLVLVWFMGVRSALTVGVALPLSGAMVLAGMQFLDVPLHQMSVTGLIISLGLLIDNAIVVVEDYKLRRRGGSDIPEAIAKAVRHLVIPLGASTATTIFAFMPIALAPGGVGDFTGSIGISVALAVASSFFLAMTVVPTIAGYLERFWPSPADEGGRRWWQSGFSHDGLTARYRRSIMLVLRRPWIGIAIACTLPVIGFALAPTLTQQFFPPVDRNQFQIQLSLPAQAAIAQTRLAVAKAEAVLRANQDVTDTFWSIGEASPRVYYNVMSGNDGVASFAAGWVNTRSPEATLRILPQLQAELSAALPSAEVLAIPFEQGPPISAPIELRIIGPDLETLRGLAESYRRVLASVDGITATRASVSTAEPKLVFVPDESALARLGMGTGDLPGQLSAGLVGAMAGTVQEGNASINVRVRFADDNRDQVADLASMPMMGANGVGVPLDELGRWELTPTASAINRRQGERLSTVQGFLVPFTLPASVLTEYRQRLTEQNLAMPPGYRVEFGGEAEQTSESAGHLASTFALFALAMVAVVTLSLNSFRHAALIFFIAILSMGLALFGVRLFGYPFGYMALIGSLGMIGLAINGAIIVLSALKASPAACAGDVDATADVVVNATRHIVSTTATTIGGFVPLIVAGGTFWPPLATAIAGGVAGSAIIALYMVPAVFALIARRQSAGASDREAEPTLVVASANAAEHEPLVSAAGRLRRV